MAAAAIPSTDRARPVLLDTCAAIWLAHGDELTADALSLIEQAEDAGGIYISPITAWEVGLLTARGRIQLQIAPEKWFERLLDGTGVFLAELMPALLIASSFLPGTPPRDPADRIICATARELGASLVTRDRAIIDYGTQGHVHVVGC